MDRGAWCAAVRGVGKSQTQLSTVMGQGTFSRREPLLLPSEIYEAHTKKMAFQLNLKEEIFLRRKSHLSNLCWKTLMDIVGHLGHCSCFKRLESTGERKHEIVPRPKLPSFSFRRTWGEFGKYNNLVVIEFQ